MIRANGHVALIAPLLGLLTATPGQAQDRAADTPVDRFGAFSGEQVQISTGTDDDTLTFRAELPVGPSQTNLFSLVASTPLHGGDDAMPASLDALANGSKITLRWGHFGLATAEEDTRATEIARDARRLCNNAQPNPSPDPETPLAACIVPTNVIGRYALENLREYIWHTVPGA